MAIENDEVMSTVNGEKGDHTKILVWNTKNLVLEWSTKTLV